MTTLTRLAFLGLSIAASLAAQSAPTPVATWNPKTAAAYLDARMAWWSTWPTAARDHETFCVSCHTSAPYGMARALLDSGPGNHARSAVEQTFLSNVVKRVRLWKEVEPFYPDEKRGKPKTAESRGTESILNALILTQNDGIAGKMSADTRIALDNMWSEQLTSGAAAGAWSWLQFHNAPWEGDSQFYGATLAAIAAGSFPGDRSTETERHLDALRAYLIKECDSQTLLDRMMLVWASTGVSGLLAPAQRESILQEALARQRPDGGFSLSSFVGGWKRADQTPLETASDGYATGVVALVLHKTGVPRDHPALARAVAWLNSNQQSDGRWLAWSLNKNRDLSTDIGHFMSDAATAYAVLALSANR